MAVKYFRGVTFANYPEPTGTIGVGGRVVYIGPTGSDDSGNGTTASPFRTITKAYDSLDLDTTQRRYIVFMDGIYTLQDVYTPDYTKVKSGLFEYRNTQGSFGIFGYTGALKNVTIMSANPVGAKIFGSTSLVAEGIFGTGTSYERRQFSIPVGTTFTWSNSQYHTIFGSAQISGSGLNAYQSFDIFGVTYPDSSEIVTPNFIGSPTFLPSMYLFSDKNAAAAAAAVSDPNLSDYANVPESQFIAYSSLWSIARDDSHKYALGLTYPIEWEGGAEGVGATMYWVKQRPIGNGDPSTYGPFTLPPEAGYTGLGYTDPAKVSWGITWTYPQKKHPNSSWGNYLWEAVEGISAAYGSLPGFTFAGMGMVFKGGNNNAEFSSILDIDPVQKRIRIDNGILWGHTDPGRENLWGWDRTAQEFAQLNNGSGNEEEVGEGGAQPTNAVLFFGSPFFGGGTFSWAFNPINAKFFAKYADVESGYTMASRLRIAPKVFTGSPTPNISAFGFGNAKDVDIVGFEIGELNGVVATQSSLDSTDALSGNYSTIFGLKFNYIHDTGNAVSALSTAQFNNLIGNLVCRPIYGGIFAGARESGLPYPSFGSNVMHRNTLMGWRQETGLRNLKSQKTIWTNNIAYAPLYGNKTNGINQYSGSRDGYLANNFVYAPENQAITVNDIDPRSNPVIIENNLFHSFGTTYSNASFAAIRNMKQVAEVHYRNNIMDFSSLEGDPWVDCVSWWNICNKRFKNNVFPFSAPSPVLNRAGGPSRRGSFLPLFYDDAGLSAYKVAGVAPGERGWSDNSTTRGTLAAYRGAWYNARKSGPLTESQVVLGPGVGYLPGPASSWGNFVESQPEYSNPTYYESGITSMPEAFIDLRNKLAHGTSSPFYDYEFTLQPDPSPQYHNQTIWHNNLATAYTTAEMKSGITIFPYSETKTTVINKDASGATLTFKIGSNTLTAAQKATLFHAWNALFVDPTDGDYRLKEEYRIQNGATVGIDFKGPPVGNYDIYSNLPRWWFPVDDFDYATNPYYVGTGDIVDLRIQLKNSPISVRLSMTNITENADWRYRDGSSLGYTIDAGFSAQSGSNASKVFTLPNSLANIDGYCNLESTPSSWLGRPEELLGYGTGYGGIFFDNTTTKTLYVDHYPNTNSSGEILKNRNEITITPLIKTFWQTGRQGGAKAPGGTTFTVILHGKNDLDSGGYAEKKSSGTINTANYWTPEWYKVSSWLKFYSKESAVNEISSSTKISFRKSPHISYMYMDLDGMPPGFSSASPASRPALLAGMQTGYQAGDTFYFFGVTGSLGIDFFNGLTNGTTLSINYGYKFTGTNVGSWRYSPIQVIDGITHGITEDQRFLRAISTATGLVSGGGETISSATWSNYNSVTGSGLLLKFVSISSPQAGFPGLTVTAQHLQNTSLLTGVSAGVTLHFGGKIRPLGYTAGSFVEYADPYGLRSNTNNPIWTPWNHSSSQKALRVRAETAYNIGTQNLLAIENISNNKKFFKSSDSDTTPNLGIVPGDFIQVTGSAHNNGVYRVLYTYDGIPPQPSVNFGSTTNNADKDVSSNIAAGATIGNLGGKPRYQYLELHKRIVPELDGTPITIRKVSHLPILEVQYKA